MAGPIDVFFSYATEDADLRDTLEGHLSMLRRDGLLRAWHAGRVGAGADWKRERDERLRAARVVLLLVSKDYLASDRLWKEEVTLALERAEKGEAMVIPILLRACLWESAPFARVQPLPANRVPVALWPNGDEAWTHVARGIRDAVGSITGPAEPIKTEVSPEPKYESDEIRKLAEQIEAVSRAGKDAAEIEAQIHRLRLRMREGGLLRAGDALKEGRYQLLKEIGDGGFATVWEAQDREREERVAVKVLHAQLARDKLRRGRFFHGAQVMARLGHEAVVRVLDQGGEDGGFFYFVMEFVEGGDLHDAVTRGRVPLDRVVPLLLTIGGVLAEAHDKRIVHRDVKPRNILLDSSGLLRLTDFDLASMADSAKWTNTGTALGSYPYMAPEQMHDAKRADARADVHGLGMTAIFCLHGKDLPVTMHGRPEEVLARLSCRQEVKGVLMKAIASQPGDRYADARAFCEALRSATMVRSPAPPPPSRTRAVVVAVMVAWVGGLWALAYWPRSMPPAVTTTAADPSASAATMAPDPSASATSTPTFVIPEPVPPPAPPGACPRDMVPIPAGTFTVGSLEGSPDERPQPYLKQHDVKLSAFCIDRTEVVLAQYRLCVAEGKCNPAGDNNTVSLLCTWQRTDQEQHPITCVNWTDAKAYCQWAGLRLPTEAEWEYAARGSQRRKFPWGNDPQPSNQLCWSGEGGDRGKPNTYGTCQVGSFPQGATPEGVLDMAGNVSEWVADWYGPYTDGSLPLDPFHESNHVIRGGSWSSNDPFRVRAAYRDEMDMSRRHPDTGFRCARGQRLRPTP